MASELPDDLTLTESQLREVIARASRMDTRPDGPSIAVVRQIAAELDIDPQSLERALAEVVTESRNAPKSVPASGRRGMIDHLARLTERVLPRSGRWLAAAFVGAVSGWVSGAATAARIVIIDGSQVSTGGAWTDVPLVLMLLALTVLNALARSRHRRLGHYASEVAALWTVFGCTWAITTGRITNDLVNLVASCLVGAFAGYWILRRGKQGDGSSAGVDFAPDQSGTGFTRPGRLVHLRAIWERVLGVRLSVVRAM